MNNPKKYIRAVFRTAITFCRLSIGKLVHRDHLRFSPLTCLCLSDGIEISRRAHIDFGSRLRTRGHCVFNAQDYGSLTFGENVFLNQGCQFNCRKEISIGTGTEFGPNVLVYDHDHAYRGGRIKKREFTTDRVTIGRNCWIGGGCIILRGSTIGDYAVIAAGSIVKGDVPPNTLFVQKRSTSIVDVG